MSHDDVTYIGSYRILDTLGAGAMGLVYRAIQEPLGREVALKVLPEHLALDTQFCERFVREAKAAAAVVDPYVVTCHDAGCADGVWFMALEFVAGGDADMLLKAAPAQQLGFAQALAIIRDCALGLQAIDAAGLVHRDIKPANIFLRTNGTAMLADLGLAFFTDGTDRMTMTGAVMGSPAYMSPEQARGESTLDIRADIYGLGATLFQLMCGKPPFEAGTPLLTLQKVLSEEHPDPRSFNSAIDEDMCAVLAMALAKNADRRYQTPAALCEDIEALLRGGALVHAGDKNKKKKRRQDTEKTPHSVQPVKRNQHKQQQDDVDVPTEETHIHTSNQQRSAPAPLLKSEALHKFDPVKVRKMATRIRTDALGLQAYLNLAPQASFPRQLIHAMLDILEITYGLDDGAILEASRPSDVARRIVLAQGDEAAPGCTGHSVYDTTIEALTIPIVMRMHADRMTAYALTAPHQVVDKRIVKQVLIHSGICYGIDVTAIHRLSDGPAEVSGRLTIARGKRGRKPQAAGFALAQQIMNTSVDDLAAANVQKVYAGDVIAMWEDAAAGEDGRDVCGLIMHYPMPASFSPEDCVGEGVIMKRDADGQLILQASNDGMCQKQLSGQIRVVEAMEIKGDLTTAHGPIHTNDLLIIHGDVADDVEIESGSDVVIMGDLKNAQIHSSGSVQVHGAIEAGDKDIIAVGCIEADSLSIRRLMAGSVCIRGEVTNSDLIATGDITVDSVIGGRLCAGGNISAVTVGASNGITTELWAGHHVDYAEQQIVAELTERGITAERESFLRQQAQVAHNIQHVDARKKRIDGAAFVKDGQEHRLDVERNFLSEQHNKLAAQAEDKRQELQLHRKNLHTLGGLKENIEAVMTVRGVTHKGAILKIANADAELIRKEESRIKRSLKHDAPS